MQNPVLIVGACCCFALSAQHAQSARILGIFPFIGKSHFFVFEPLMKALAARGHDVHVISHFPQETPLKNYTDVDISGSFTQYASTDLLSFQVFGGSPSRFAVLLDALSRVGSNGPVTCEYVLTHPSIVTFLLSNQTFDLVINELFNTDCLLGIAHKFQSPHIAITASVLLPWAGDRFGNPDNPSYIPMSMASYSDRMTFVERLENTVFTVITKIAHYYMFSRPQQVIASHYFGADMPSLDALARNTSLILVNSHPSLHRARPLVPAVIDVSGMHVSEPTTLPEDLDQWISEAPEGVIFFSMGSVLNPHTLPAEKTGAFLRAFSELPQRVLWKFNGDSLPDKPDNIKVDKWMPQRDILAHPNVRLLVTHCGLLSVIEAAMSHVPMVCIPMFGDHHTNWRAVQAAGVAVRLDYGQITKETVLAAVHGVLGNSSYQENAKRLANEYTDRPLSAMDTAIFWTEYVIRHKGARHLRSAAVDLPWYQYLLLDVALLVSGLLLAGTFAVYLIMKMLICLGRRIVFIKLKQQ